MYSYFTNKDLIVPSKDERRICKIVVPKIIILFWVFKESLNELLQPILIELLEVSIFHFFPHKVWHPTHSFCLSPILRHGLGEGENMIWALSVISRRENCTESFILWIHSSRSKLMSLVVTKQLSIKQWCFMSSFLPQRQCEGWPHVSCC